MLAKIVAGIDYLVPLLDVGYVFFWIPGVILAAFGYPLIFSWWSMLLLPITVLIYGLLRRWQEQHVLRPFRISLPADRRGFFGLPARLPGAGVDGVAARLLAVRHRLAAFLEVSAPSVAPNTRWPSMLWQKARGSRNTGAHSPLRTVGW